MNIHRSAGIIILIFAFMIGCAGNYGKIKTQSQTDSRATIAKLKDTWSDYYIWYKSTVMVFDPKNDDKTLVVSGRWAKVKDQKTWSEIVRINVTKDGRVDAMYANSPMTGMREILSPDNQFYGYVIHQQRDLVSAKVVDDNTMQVYHHRARYGGP